jgi:hypothetical protein
MSDPETRKDLEKRIDELARRYAETHDEEIKAEIKVESFRPVPIWK